MLFNVQRDEAEEKVFTIRWPDTQFEFYLVLRDSGFKKAKDGVYILMDKFRREFYIGETGAAKSAGIFNRFQVHKQDKKFWDRALVITDLHDEFKQDNVRRYYEWELNRIAKERVSANQLITIHSSAGPQDKPYGAETRMETILAVCRFVGIPWAFSEDAHDKKKSAVKKAACNNKPTKAVREWLVKTYPAIEADARRRGARIMWADESATMACQQKVRGYASRGKPPVARIPANRSVRCNMISAVGNRGDMHFMLYDEAMNVDLFKSFITRLIRDMRCPVSLIVDNLRVHHATVLTEWLKEREEKDGFTLHYLPSYSPELNPDECLNRDLKAHLSERSVPTSKDSLKKSVRRHLQSRKSNPESIKRLFRKKEVAYAAGKDS